MGLENEVPLAVIQPGSEFEDEGLVVERFVRRFDNESYRMLAYHAALPLILTPELVNYLRNAFLRGLDPPLPWIAEADLLLSELCDEVGYEQYAMKPAVRNYLMAEMRKKLGPKRMQDVARLLLRYIQHLKQTKSETEQRELHTQELAAMVCLEDKRVAVARELAQLFRHHSAVGSVNEAGLTRLANLTQTLAPQLSAYPQLVRYAEECLSALLSEGSAPVSGEPVLVAGIELSSIQGRAQRQEEERFDPATIQALKARLADKNGSVRTEAAEALASLSRSEDLPLLRELTKDQDSGVRASAMKALATLAQAEDLPLLRELTKDQDSDVRASAMKALARFAQAEDLPLLRELAKDQDWDVRTAAVKALARFPRLEALPLLRELAKDRDSDVRARTVEALASLSRPEDLPLLRALAKDRDSNVRARAVEALASFSQPEDLPLLRELAKDRDSNVRARAVEALASFSRPEDLPLLRALAKDQNSNVRAVATEALRQLGRPARTPGTVFISYSHDPADPTHERRVAGLAASLLRDGFEVFFDQKRGDEEKDLPWPIWMEDKIFEADHVLLVCTELYLKKVRQQVAEDEGQGVCWEANIIYALLYERKLNTAKFSPVLFSPADRVFIPTPLKGRNCFMVDSQSGYNRLYAFLTGQHRAHFPKQSADLQTVAKRTIKPLFAPASLRQLGRSATVFISYSHDPADPTHAERVVELAASLTRDGFEVFFDQNRGDEEKKVPWEIWMEDKILEADHVLMVCTELYRKKIRQEIAEDEGEGVCWEAGVIFALLYRLKRNTTKFLPVIFSPADEQFIPLLLQGKQWFVLDTQSGYERLYAFLTGQHRARFPKRAASLRTVEEKTITPLFAPPDETTTPARTDSVSAPDEREEQIVLPSNEMPDGAVFISYARADVAAVRNLYNGLTTRGIKAWFDYDRLKFGDEYESKIKQSIKRCAVFLPIISRHTEDPRPHFFKREWNFAVDRSLSFLPNHPFIIPVAVDDSSARTAHVPDRFLTTHWTRLPNGEVTEEFATQLKTLLAEKGRTSSA